VNDDLDAVARATSAVHARFGGYVAASRSQPYYLDVSLEVQCAARRVIASNADEGFASAVERFILPHSSKEPVQGTHSPPGPASRNGGLSR